MTGQNMEDTNIFEYMHIYANYPCDVNGDSWWPASVLIYVKKIKIHILFKLKKTHCSVDARLNFLKS